MKKEKMKKMVLLGISAGILMAEQSVLEAVESSVSINLDYVLAKPSCKAHGGCGGLTAYREVNRAAEQNDGDDKDQAEDEKAKDQGIDEKTKNL